jgi:hypothetical protein
MWIGMSLRGVLWPGNGVHVLVKQPPTEDGPSKEQARQ